MGFLDLLSASKLTASYDVQTRKLTLSAEGITYSTTYGIEFRREPSSSGLKFVLEGWFGQPTSQTEPLSFSESFDIQLPSSAYPTDYLTVVAAEHPSGVPVRICFNGALNPPAEDGYDIPSKAPATEFRVMESVAKPIHALWGEVFTVHANASQDSRMGEVKIKYDPEFLVVQTASIEDTDIVWKFEAIQAGHTQVRVFTYGGLSPHLLSVTHDVRVLAPDPFSSRTISSCSGIDTEVTSFLGHIGAGRDKVLAEFPDSQLLEVIGMTKSPRGADSPSHLSLIELFFQTKKGFAVIHSKGAHHWGTPTFVEEDPVQGGVVTWPVPMSAETANTLLREKGYKGPYTKLSLRRPVFLRFSQPFWIFHMTNGRHVYIGAFDQLVSLEGPGVAREALARR